MSTKQEQRLTLPAHVQTKQDRELRTLPASSAPFLSEHVRIKREKRR